MSLANQIHSIFERSSEASLQQKTFLDEQGTFKAISTARVLTRFYKSHDSHLARANKDKRHSLVFFLKKRKIENDGENLSCRRRMIPCVLAAMSWREVNDQNRAARYGFLLMGQLARWELLS